MLSMVGVGVKAASGLQSKPWGLHICCLFSPDLKMGWCRGLTHAVKLLSERATLQKAIMC